MDCFVKDFIVFIGRRVVRAKALTALFDIPEEVYAELNAEEKANAKESVERDAIYLQGLADGLRLATLTSDKESGHV
ncbi:MAG: hypothetical protein P4N59_11810 [Negativicutes bacterium]|nr:hypothetical protein [Negativicutes bacterium]